MYSSNRRDLLKLSGLAALSSSAPALLWRPAQAQTKLTGVTYLTQSYKALFFGITGFVQQLGAAGGVTVDFYDSAQLVKADEQITALRSRLIDFMFHTSSYITGSTPVLGITGLPVLCEELYRHGERLAIDSPLWRLINEELAKEDLFMLSAGGGLMEPEYIWSTADSPVRSLADLQGKKVRIVSVEATQALEKYGAAAVRIPSSETYLALQRGTIDAAVANISTIIGRSLHEQLAAVYRLPTTAFAICAMTLKSRWDELDDASQQALWQAARWYDENSARHVNQTFYPDEYWPQVEQAGIEIIEPSEEDLARFRADSEAVWEDWKNEVGADIGERAIKLAQGEA